MWETLEKSNFAIFKTIFSWLKTITWQVANVLYRYTLKTHNVAVAMWGQLGFLENMKIY